MAAIAFTAAVLRIFTAPTSPLEHSRLHYTRPYDSAQRQYTSEPVTAKKYDLGVCIRVVDGDTIIVRLNGRKERVRLIGVDTPETVRPDTPVQYYGKEASAFTRQMVERKPVRLEYDWQRRDKYDRLLAYVYLEDGTFLNAELIKQGYGHAYTRFPFKYLKRFRGYEREARENGRGLWGNKQ